MDKCAKFHKDSLSGKKLNSIFRARMNFRRRPILCTTLYRNLMQASNFDGTFGHLFLWIFLWNFHRRCLSTFSIPWCKKVKNDQKLKSRGSCLKKHYSKFIQPFPTPKFASWKVSCARCEATWPTPLAPVGPSPHRGTFSTELHKNKFGRRENFPLNFTRTNSGDGKIFHWTSQEQIRATVHSKIMTFIGLSGRRLRCFRDDN